MTGDPPTIGRFPDVQLLERPVVERGERTVPARPVENVLDLL